MTVKSRPKYTIVRDRLFEQISRGEYASGSAIPTEKALSETFGVSITTVRRAVSDLVDQGLLVRRQGSGMYVQKPSPKLRSTFVTVVVGVGTTSFSQPILIALESQLRNRGFAMAISFANSPQECNDILSTLPGTQAGTVLLSLPEIDAALIHRLRNDGHPAVAVDTELAHSPLPFAGIDNYKAGYDLGRFLIEQGRRNLAFAQWVVGGATKHTVISRYEGVCEAARECGVGVELFRNRSLYLDQASFAKFLEDHSHVDAIIGENDPVALAVYRALVQNGRDVPSDCGVVGFDDLPELSNSELPLTTMRQPLSRIGEAAAQELLHVMQHGYERIGKVMFPCELVIRGSH